MSQEGVKPKMKSPLFKLSGLAIALAVFGSVIIASICAQQLQPIPHSAATKWVGYLVVGRSDSFDRMTPEPSPTTLHQVQIGLRSDGVVVWRETTATAAKKATTAQTHDADR